MKRKFRRFIWVVSKKIATLKARVKQKIATPVFTLKLMWSADIVADGGVRIVPFVPFESDADADATSGLELTHDYIVFHKETVPCVSVKGDIKYTACLRIGIHKLLYYDCKSCVFETADKTAYAAALAYVEELNEYYG